jgi:hypothetical protein
VAAGGRAGLGEARQQQQDEDGAAQDHRVMIAE